MLPTTATYRAHISALDFCPLVAVFILNTAVLLLRGSDWWAQVLTAYPAQSILEPSTALFAAYAVEAGSSPSRSHSFARVYITRRAMWY